MALTEQEIRKLTDEILRELTGQMSNIAMVEPVPAKAQPKGRWLCDTVEEAVSTAKAAQGVLAEMPLERRAQLVEAMRKAAIENAQSLAALAHKETGYGRTEDKIQKNLLAARRTPGVEDLPTQAFTGDTGMTLVELAPFGVIGSITPSTNPTSTIINNSISMIAAGNSVVFNPHPSAKKSSQEAMRVLSDALVAAGAPPGLITTVREPSIQSGQAIMTHEDISLLSVTGGEAVVAAAAKTGKKVIAAGPGNPPVIVDDTADLPQAAKKIVDGASFDNNVLCIAEKEVFAFSAIVDALMKEMERNGAFRISGAQIQQVMDTTLLQKEGRYLVNRNYVGRDAAVILRDSGISFPGNPRLIIAEVPKTHPFVMVEMLMPVLPIARVQDMDEAMEASLHAEQGFRHSAMIHSSNVHHLSLAARRMKTTIFVKNAPSYAGLGFGGEGFTTMTIATPTGEGLTSARTFTRQRRCVLYGEFRIC